MAIPSRQIGGSTTTNLLWQISKQLEELICVRSGGCGSTTTTTSTAIPITTTTTTTFLTREYCVWSTDLYTDPIETSEYDVATNTLTAVPIDNDIVAPQLFIASTSTKLWKYSAGIDTIREWWISSYPASLTFNRDILVTPLLNYIRNSDIVAVDNNTILTTLNASSLAFPSGIPYEVYLWKYDISTTSAGVGSSVFAFGSAVENYVFSMMFTTDSKLICTTNRPGTIPYLLQYSYPDGALELELSLASLLPWGSGGFTGVHIITYAHEIYLVRTTDNTLFKIELNAPYTITEVTADLGWNSSRVFSSSTGECNDVSFTAQITTTTSSTSSTSSTTTTSTTLAPTGFNTIYTHFEAL